jgi:hypothetical protein
LIGASLKIWGRSAGWTVLWNVPVDWPAAVTTGFSGPFEAVAKAVITALRSNGADISARAYPPNTTLVVSTAGGNLNGGHP